MEYRVRIAHVGASVIAAREHAIIARVDTRLVTTNDAALPPLTHLSLSSTRVFLHVAGSLLFVQ